LHLLEIADHPTVEHGSGSSHLDDREPKLLDQIPERIGVDRGVVVKLRCPRLIMAARVEAAGDVLASEPVAGLEERDPWRVAISRPKRNAVNRPPGPPPTIATFRRMMPPSRR